MLQDVVRNHMFNEQLLEIIKKYQVVKNINQRYKTMCY